MRIRWSRFLCWLLGHPFPMVEYVPNVVLQHECPRCGLREFAGPNGWIRLPRTR